MAVAEDFELNFLGDNPHWEADSRYVSIFIGLQPEGLLLS